ncbi:MAG: putative ABC transporter permease [Oscillospiraceae bacterium]|nr:putative ABC transporter permease [Oscillospiraceae bacterium]
MNNADTADKPKVSRIARILILWLCTGMIYLTIEGLWRGWTNIVMLPVGGLCGVLIGALNQSPRFYKCRIVWQCLLGALIVLAVEFISGCILNLWLGLGIWDYTGMTGNILGQVCLQYGFLWFFLIPFAIWTEDYIRWVFWGEDEPYTVLSIYKDLFTLK